MSVYGNSLFIAESVLLERKRWKNDDSLTLEYAKYCKSKLSKIKEINDIKISDYKGCSIEVTFDKDVNAKDLLSKIKDILNECTTYFDKKYKKQDADFSWNNKVVNDTSALFVLDCYISYED